MAHNTFRNQPSYKTFDKKLGDDDEPLFRLLYEVDPVYAKQYINGRTRPLHFNVLTDPRTKQEVPKIICDSTKPHSWDNFFSAAPNSDLLCKLGGDILKQTIANAQRLGESNDEESKRKDEIECVQEFIRQFERREHMNLYAPMKPFVKLYRDWYQRKTARLIQELPDTKYVTYTALPHVNLCMALNVNTATIENINLLERKGSVMLMPYEPSEQMYRSIYLRLDRYINMASDKDSKNEEHNSIPKAVEANTFIMPFESLLFLLTTGYYIDLPTEMLLDVKSTDDNDRFKRIEFKMPLPTSNCGWHTNSAIMEYACKVFASQSGSAKWLDLNVDTVNIEENNPPEINGIQRNPEPYKVCQFDEYLENAQQHNDESVLKRNSTTVAWQLKSSDAAEEVFQFYTVLETPGSFDSKCEKPLGCHLYKLENKTRFGCEVFTKYELLKAWLQMKLLQSNTAHCTRLDLEEFHLVTEEELELEDIEQQLLVHYRVDMPMVLGNLHKFLQMLIDTTSKISNETFMLRLKLHQHEKLLLCGPSLEQSQHAVSLHSILQQNVSDLYFSMQTDYLPIDEDLIGPMHEQHDVLPCLYPAKKFESLCKRPTEDEVKKERERILNHIAERTKKNDANNKRKRNKSNRRVRKQQKTELQTQSPEVDSIFTL